MPTELAARLVSEIAERYPAFLHGGRGSVGLKLSSADWRQIISALEAVAAPSAVPLDALPTEETLL